MNQALAGVRISGLPDKITASSEIIPNSFSVNELFASGELWNYQTKQSPESLTCIRLRKLAEKKHWNPYIDVDWTHNNRHNSFPFTSDADPFFGFEDYDRLPIQDRIQISWQYHGMQVSEILHGEQLALLCSAQLISLMPCMEGRLFASTQAADEARHVEFFRRYLLSAGLNIDPPSRCLQRLTIQALQNPHWEIKVLICQILIESLALAQFSYLVETHTQTLLRSGLRRILDDEARHVKFGTDYLASLFGQRSPEQLNEYGHFVVDKAFELASSDNHCLAIARKFHWNTYKLRHHLRKQRINNPALLRKRFRQLWLNISTTGLLNSSVEERLQRFIGN